MPNINSGDALLTSFWGDEDLTGSVPVNGLVIDLKADDLIIDGRLKARFTVTETLTQAGGGTFTFQVFTESGTPPSVLVGDSGQVAIAEGAAGYTWEYLFPADVQERYVMLAITGSEAFTAGRIKADLMPIKS